MSELQGACREGASCIHTAFILRETIATSMESSRHCFVAFFDVAKAFDTVWIDGLFKQMFDLGISGKTWRLLYRGYLNFKCCVKIQGSFSEWYEPRCGIHQGGFMSLMKYAIFINSLLVDLKKSGLCCKIYRTPSTPLGYADDVATCCLSKQRLDKAMALVHAHGCTWRYDLNAKKSGVLVYGESIKEHECNRIIGFLNLVQTESTKGSIMITWVLETPFLILISLGSKNVSPKVGDLLTLLLVLVYVKVVLQWLLAM